MPEMVAPRALVFRPLVKGNEALGTRLVDERLDNGGLIKINKRPFRPNRFLYVFFEMVPLFLLLGCNLSFIVDLFAALHELASASARTLLKLASSVRALLKPYGDKHRGKTYAHAPSSAISGLLVSD